MSLIRKYRPEGDIVWALNAILANATWNFPAFSEGVRDLGETGLAVAKEEDRAKAQGFNQNQKYRTQTGMISVVIDDLILPRLKNLVGLSQEERLVVSGRSKYRPGGFMGWHSNANAPGMRVYCIWSEEEQANFFRYEDPHTGLIITDWDHPGWTIRTFQIPDPDEAPLWHCVHAGSRRFALGFRLV